MTENTKSIERSAQLHSRPRVTLPSGACDCHVHVFGPVARFPMSDDRSYTPGEASVEALIAHQEALGLDRVIVVQPSIYGADNRCTLWALKELGGSARGIVVLDGSETTDLLRNYDAGGIRGIRLNLLAASNSEISEIRRQLLEAAKVAEVFGWHVQIFTSLDVINEIATDLAAMPVPLVIDHFGMVRASGGNNQTGLHSLLRIIDTGKAYVKLSAPYLVSAEYDQSDVIDLVEAFVRANPDRLLWGSNWPHPAGGTGSKVQSAITPFRNVDDGIGLDRLSSWLQDSRLMTRILTDNPARLFGF